MNVDVFSHPWLSGLFGDDELATPLSAPAMLSNMKAVEAAHALALAEADLVDLDIAQRAAKVISATSIEMEDLKAGTASDGVVVPALVRALLEAAPTELHVAIHKGLTSQDVIDTSLILALKSITEILRERLTTLLSTLKKLEHRFGANKLMGRTRMQAAMEITVADRLGSWRRPLVQHCIRFDQMQPRLMRLQLGGAAGDRAAWCEQGEIVAQAMAKELALFNAPSNWHTERDSIAEFANWLSLITGTPGKMGQDVTLMAQQGLDEIKMAGGGGSSAMPHKQNPVQAELLVTLSQFNATQLSGIHLAMVHEQERSGAAWSLEWMILPQMIMTAGVALAKANEIGQSIECMGRAHR